MERSIRSPSVDRTPDNTFEVSCLFQHRGDKLEIMEEFVIADESAGGARVQLAPPRPVNTLPPSNVHKKPLRRGSRHRAVSAALLLLRRMASFSYPPNPEYSKPELLGGNPNSQPRGLNGWTIKTQFGSLWLRCRAGTILTSPAF